MDRDSVYAHGIESPAIQLPITCALRELFFAFQFQPGLVLFQEGAEPIGCV